MNLELIAFIMNNYATLLRYAKEQHELDNFWDDVSNLPLSVEEFDLINVMSNALARATVNFHSGGE